MPTCWTTRPAWAQWLIGGAAVLGAAWLAWTGWVLAGRQTPPAPAGMTAQNPPR
jgi:poly(3-hydroxyalkanoate) synthetase